MFIKHKAAILKHQKPFIPKFKASQLSFQNSKSQLRFGLNLAGAYPEDASGKFWNRTYTLRRTSSPELVIEDQFSMKEYKGESKQHFVTMQLPLLKKTGEIKLKEGKSIYFYYPAAIFEIRIEELPLTDKRLLTYWKQDELNRVILTDKKKIL